MTEPIALREWTDHSRSKAAIASRSFFARYHIPHKIGPMLVCIIAHTNSASLEDSSLIVQLSSVRAYNATPPRLAFNDLSRRVIMV